ncbi:uncharacterized protein TNCV_3774751 [Trichonephila clavipes]|nr:uncharacterized protein TNCV_3774751 [Trichonephila clavipes]
MAFILKDSPECVKSELELFNLPGTQTVIQDGQRKQFHPLSNVFDNAPVEFHISGSAEDYIDLSQTQLYVKAKIVKGDNTPITKDDTIGPVNLFLHSLFSQVDVSLNDRVVSNSSNTYPYRSYIETLLNHGYDSKTSQLTAELFHKDSDDGLKKRTEFLTTPIKEEKGMDDLRVVHVKVKGEQEIMNAVIDIGAQMPVVRADVVEGQHIDNRGSIQITSAFGEHEMGEVKSFNMEINDLRRGVVPISKNLVSDMLICSSDYEELIENSQLIRNPAILREPSKEEGIINSTDSKSVCSQEVVIDLGFETYTQSLLNAPNENSVVVESKASHVQTNGHGIKESNIKVVLSADLLDSENIFILLEVLQNAGNVM